MPRAICGGSGFFKSLCPHVPKHAGGKTHTLISKVSSTDFTLPCVTVFLEALFLLHILTHKQGGCIELPQMHIHKVKVFFLLPL